MARRDQGDLHELVGAYALDALDADEAREFEAHLDECPRCRAELRDHRDTASYLAHAGAPAPDGVWERIAEQLDETPPDMARVLPMMRRRAVRWVWVAAAAAIVGLVAGAVVQDQVSGDASPSLSALAASARRQTGARLATLRDGDVAVAHAVVTPDGRGYVTGVTLPPLDAAHTYQLWGLPPSGDPISLGVLGRQPHLSSFTADVAVTRIAISVERAGGATAPTSSPIAGTLHGA